MLSHAGSRHCSRRQQNVVVGTDQINARLRLTSSLRPEFRAYSEVTAKDPIVDGLALVGQCYSCDVIGIRFADVVADGRRCRGRVRTKDDLKNGTRVLKQCLCHCKSVLP